MKNPLLAFLLTIASAIAPSYAELQFTHLETDLALPTIQNIERDNFGHLWIACNNLGLYRYDGYEIKKYSSIPEDDSTISGDFIRDVLEDSKGRMWFATQNGLSLYNREYDNFTRFKHTNDAHSFASNQPVKVVESDSREIWVLSRHAIHRFDEKNNQFLRYPKSENQPSRSYFTSLIIDDKGRFWITETGSRIWSFDPKTKTFSNSILFKRTKGSNKRIHRDSSGDLWINSNFSGFYRFYPETKTVKHYPRNKDGTGPLSDNVANIFEYPKGKLLVLTNGSGLSIFDKKTETFEYQSYKTENANGLSSDGLLSAHLDEEGILWLGNSRSGVDYYNPNLNRFYTFRNNPHTPKHSVANNVIGCFLDNGPNQILIGTDGGGISVFDKKSKSVRQLDIPLRSGVIRSLQKSSDGRLWVTTWNEGIQVFNYLDGEYRQDNDTVAKLKEFENIDLWDLKIDAEDRVWISRLSGAIDVYDKNVEELLRILAVDENNPNITKNLYKMPSGEILYPARDGIYRIPDFTRKPERFIEINSPTNVAYEPISETYYVGTRKDGLYSFKKDGTPLNHFGKEHGLPDPLVRSIQPINEFEIWIATDNGLSRLDLKRNKFSNFYKRDGLQGNQYFSNSSLTSKEGNLFFGGTSGFSTFDPTKLSTNTQPPFVHIERIHLFGSLLNHTDSEPLIDKHPSAIKQLELNWKQNHLRFDFTGISMTYPHNNRFAYKLDGFDTEWNETNSEQRFALYTNIDPGNYTFRVKASNNDDVWSPKEATIQLVITPPFWQRTWFYAFLILVCSSTIYLWVLYRERHLKHDKEKLSKLVEAKTSELKSHEAELEQTIKTRTQELVTALDEAQEADRLKTQFIANLSHEIRTPLNAIIGFTALISEEGIDSETREHYSKIISENSDSLLTLIEDILDFSIIASNQMKIVPTEFQINEFIDNIYSSHAIRLSTKKVAFKLANNLHKQNLTIFADKVRIKQIIDNLMTNAVKFTQEGFIRLGVFRNSNTICFYVEDSGPGIPEEEQKLIFEMFVQREVDSIAARRGVGLGLTISKELAYIMKGDLTLKSKVGKGSVFSLEIPLSIVVKPSVKEQRPAIPVEKLIRPGKRVLIIEDEYANYKYIEVTLKYLDIEATWAQSGEEGLELLQKGQTFDLILLDIKMPGIDGFETIKRIRKIAPKIIVIAQTAYAMKSDELRIKQAGFNDYLAKPIQIENLLQTVEKRLESTPN